MVNFFAFLFFGSIIGLVVGVFKPTTVVRWKKEPTRKDVFKIYFTLGLVSLIFIGIFAPEVKNKQKDANETSIVIEKEQTIHIDKDFEKDKQEILKLLNIAYHDLLQTEKKFSYFQRNIDSDIYTAISNAKTNEPKVMKLTFKSYPDSIEDDSTEEQVEEYIKILHNSNLFLQMAYNNFLDYIDT